MPFISSVRGSYGAQGRFGKKLGLGDSTGGTITTAGGFRYHTFTTVGSSTFTPSSSGNIEMIMVGAGGGGGASGAGAGGLLYTASTAVTTSPVSIVLGSAGIGRGSAWSGDSVEVSHGQNTTVTIGGTTLNARGGQGAKGWDIQADTTLNIWGSGSGGPQSSSGPYTGGGYTPGQGFPGGDDPGAGTAPYPSGGGGGAGAKGVNTDTNTTSGAGGAGLQYSAFANATSTGANGGYYAGGGAGCNHTTPNPATSGGIGGGGSHPGGAGTPSAGVNGTGGGGSGGTNSSPTSAGGTGIVIIRYPL